MACEYYMVLDLSNGDSSSFVQISRDFRCRITYDIACYLSPLRDGDVQDKGRARS